MNSIFYLVAALKQNITIRQLYLSCNHLTSSDAQQLKSLLKNNSTLQTLELNDNSLGCAGVQAVADGLADQPAGPGDGLQRLSLSSNKIDLDSIMALTQALPFCRNLRFLDLSRNPLGDDAIEILVDGLAVLPTLRSLRLTDCSFSDQGQLN